MPPMSPRRLFKGGPGAVKPRVGTGKGGGYAMAVKRLALLAAIAVLPACATVPRGDERVRWQFLERIRALCGKAYEGRVVSTDEADREMAAARLVMHVRACGGDTIRIPFHVGDDRSRTWVISHTDRFIRLKHDHRHADGSADARTLYGGDTVSPGTAGRQEFPADLYSRDLFVRENIPASAANVWAIEIEPGRSFAYELRRPGRHFRVEFDLTRPVPAPPPWGAD